MKKPAPAAKARGKKKAIESDEDDIVDELLSDDEDVAPAPEKTEARPSRRAAATKARYVVDDAEDEDSVMQDASASVGQDEGSEGEFYDVDD